MANTPADSLLDAEDLADTIATADGVADLCNLKISALKHNKIHISESKGLGILIAAT